MDRPRDSSSMDSGLRPSALPARTTLSSCGTLTSVEPARMPYPKPCAAAPGATQGPHWERVGLERGANPQITSLAAAAHLGDQGLEDRL